MNPVARFIHERDQASAAKDPMAGLCMVANTDKNGDPAVRTLVLRSLDEDLALFVNATSPKWPNLQDRLAIVTYWPSVQVQYRLAVDVTLLEPHIVAQSWLMRPDPPKRMDWFYEQMATQSTPIADRETLLTQLAQVTLPEPLVAPANARGLLLNVLSLERLDLTQANGVHDRVLFTNSDGRWTVTTLVP